ncbi:MAG: tryptophan synthase subunit beta [Lachnospiraceae bacterium]|nr:tryptophan synthase subunit beta [Lachnospiraceae bacterium]
MANENDSRSKGRFGLYGGQYVPETLMNVLAGLEQAYHRCREDERFEEELRDLLQRGARRPSRLYPAVRLSEELGGAQIWLKREDQNPTGSHCINAALGQVLLAKWMGKKGVIADTASGGNGVATAVAASLLGLRCDIFMGLEDMARQSLQVDKMRLLGATVHIVQTGAGTWKDALSEAMREWSNRVEDTNLVMASAIGPHPYPTIVREFQNLISEEIRERCLQEMDRLPDVVIAPVGGGALALGAFDAFLQEEEVQLIGCEAAGEELDGPESPSALTTGRKGIFHGMKTYFCQDDEGRISPVHSVAAGLTYPGVNPELAALVDEERVDVISVTDEEALDAFSMLARTEGILPALESAHALACAMSLAPEMRRDQVIVVVLSGSGDKDCEEVVRIGEEEKDEQDS